MPTGSGAESGGLFQGGIEHPHMGCVLAKLKGPQGDVPPHVMLPRTIGNTGGNMPHGQSAGYLGKTFDPFVLNADPSVAGLQIPTCFTPDDGSMEPPEPRLGGEADRVMVVLLAEDHMAANARKPTKSGTTWADYGVRLRELCEASSSRFMPVQLTESGWPLDSRFADINFLRAWAVDDVEQRRKFIARRLVHLLIRRLRPHEDDEDAPAMTIFLSHTKMDLESEPRVVKALLAAVDLHQLAQAFAPVSRLVRLARSLVSRQPEPYLTARCSRPRDSTC